VSGLYEQLDELRKLYGSESIEEILRGIIGRRRRLNRMIELQSNVALSGRELNEFQVLKRQWQQYIADLANSKRKTTPG
jgi:predicted CopG family antitoxin